MALKMRQSLAQLEQEEGRLDAAKQHLTTALAKDPNHLEAQWLLAAALGQQGKLDELVAPLQAAVAGDLLRWGNASLDHPAFHAFMQSLTRGQGRLVNVGTGLETSVLGLYRRALRGTDVAGAAPPARPPARCWTGR